MNETQTYAMEVVGKAPGISYRDLTDAVRRRFPETNPVSVNKYVHKLAEGRYIVRVQDGENGYTCWPIDHVPDVDPALLQPHARPNRRGRPPRSGKKSAPSGNGATAPTITVTIPALKRAMPLPEFFELHAQVLAVAQMLQQHGLSPKS